MPTAILSSYQKKDSDKSNPALVVDLDGKDLNGKDDIVEYIVKIKNKQGVEIKRIIDSKPIKETIPIDEGTYYIEGECTDSDGKTDEADQIELTISKLNYSPVPTFNVNPSSGKSPLESLITLSGKDADGDSIKYNVLIDENRDGTIDETITQDSPISVTRQFTNNSYVYGKCTDPKEASGTVGPVEITISETPVVNPPIVSLSMDTSTGTLPLEKRVSVTGTKKDYPIAKYQMGVDQNEDGEINNDEIIINSTSPISNKTIIFTEPGTKKIYGIDVDSKGNKGINGPTTIIVEPSNQLDDLTRSVAFTNTPYIVGGKLTFSAQLINNTNPLNSLEIDNRNRDSLEYKLLRKLGQGVYEETLDKPFKSELIITFNYGEKINKGMLNFEQKNNDELKLTFSNVKIEKDGNSRGAGDNPITHSEDVDCYIFKQKGTYLIQTNLKYSVGGETSVRNLTFLSDNFSVN